MATTEVARLIQAITASGRSQGDIASYLRERTGRDIQNYHVSRMLNGVRKVAHDEMDALRDLAKQLASDASQTSSWAHFTESAEVVPLFGGGAYGVLTLKNENRIGDVPIHPAQRGTRTGFAVVATGGDLAPRIMQGDVVYAMRNRPPRQGGYCLVELTSGEILFRGYESEDEQTIFTFVLNNQGKRQAPIARRDVAALHAIVGNTFS